MLKNDLHSNRSLSRSFPSLPFRGHLVDRLVIQLERVRVQSLATAVEDSLAEMRRQVAWWGERSGWRAGGGRGWDLRALALLQTAEEKVRLRKEHQRLDSLQSALEAER